MKAAIVCLWLATCAPCGDDKPDLEALWKKLGDIDDARQAWLAIFEMIEVGEPAAEFIDAKLAWCRVNADDKATARLIEQLDSDDYETRERAARALIDAGASSDPVLLDAEKNHKSLDVRLRIKQVIKAIDDAVTSSPEVLRAGRALKVLEDISTRPKGDKARAALKRLADESRNGRIKKDAQRALDRVIQREKGEKR